MRCLLVEDDKMLGTSLQKLLRKSGYAIDWERNYQRALDAVTVTDYSLVLLDLGLPDQDGSKLLAMLRDKNNQIPVIIITARDTLQDKVTNFNLGADDYIIKPFAYEELEARIRARLRRDQGWVNPKIKFGGLELDPITKNCVLASEKITLSAKEFAILLILAEQPTRHFSRQQLEDKIYDWSQDIQSNVLEYHIHQIRKKCGKNIIINQRGFGYKLGLAA